LRAQYVIYRSTWIYWMDSFFLKLLQQVYLAGGGVIIAMTIGIPLGIWIARKDKIKKCILAVCNVLQTLPSLALLGFLLPFFGIGIKTAMVALVLYAMLPILRNTVTGLLGVTPDLLEAAESLGLTQWQRMKLVELPLALPVIIAGIRIATPMSVGIATLAALIGAGGLGDFIYEGLSLNDTPLILWGALPIAGLALFLEYVIARIEKSLTARNINATLKKVSAKRKWLKLFSILIFCGILFSFYLTGSSHDQVRIGTKNFTEQLILGELLAQLLAANTSLQVVKQFNLGGSVICHKALLRGDIDIYPEYTGTAYRVILKKDTPRTAAQIYDYVRTHYAKRFNVEWLDVFGFNNTNALAVHQSFAVLHSLKAISDLKPISSQLTIGVPADFMKRSDGFLGLTQRYHLKFGQIKLMEVGLMYQAMKLGQINTMLAFSTDGRIPRYDLSLLKDDLNLFPTYQAGPLVRSAFIKRHPEIRAVLHKLAGKINNQKMQNLNYQVEVLKRSPEEVAKNFLKMAEIGM
jgi:osmoprotectant transport system permease protein